MWISKDVYEHIEEDRKRLRAEVRAMNDLLAQAKAMSLKGEPGVALTEKCYLVLTDTVAKFCDRLSKAEDEVLTLTAERDWYKNAYAEQGCLDALTETRIEEVES